MTEGSRNGVVFTARLRLLSVEAGGRKMPIFSNYRPNFDVDSSWQGTPSLNDGRISLIEREELGADVDALVTIEPSAPEFWGRVRVGSTIALQEGSKVVGHATIETVMHPEGFTPTVAAFVCRAREFCAFVESAEKLPLMRRLEGARDRIIDLYASACALPFVEPTDDKDAASKPAPKPWSGFEAFEHYSVVYDPYGSEATVSIGSLSDDILDVYSDVTGGLALWDSGSFLGAAWEWRFSFDSHWGDHAVDALRALHRACSRSAFSER